MIPKQRVYNALERREVDRVPMSMWYHPAIYGMFQECYGWDKDTADSMLGNDIKSVHVSINREMFRSLEPGEVFVDDWGVSWTREGWYNQVCCNPLADSDASSLIDYRFPDPYNVERYKPLSQLCDQYCDEYFIGVDVSGSIFEPCYHIRSMEKLLVDMLVDREAVEVFFDHAAEFTKQLCLQALKYPVDWIWLGDDVGGQEAMMMSPILWRELLKPRLASIITAIKTERPGVLLAYHSCGAIRPIIGDLIEIGVDVLNPIQPLCPGMNPLELKQEFGSELAFMGGLDTQELLIYATAEEVYRQTRSLIEGMSTGGGYIMAASHTIQPDTPLENILAISRAVGGLSSNHLAS